MVPLFLVTPSLGLVPLARPISTPSTRSSRPFRTSSSSLPRRPRSARRSALSLGSTRTCPSTSPHRSAPNRPSRPATPIPLNITLPVGPTNSVRSGSPSSCAAPSLCTACHASDAFHLHPTRADDAADGWPAQLCRRPGTACGIARLSSSRLSGRRQITARRIRPSWEEPAAAAALPLRHRQAATRRGRTLRARR